MFCFDCVGMGPMPWTINSEIYPMWARSSCNSVATSVNWLFNLLISMTFLTLTKALTKEGKMNLWVLWEAGNNSNDFLVCGTLLFFLGAWNFQFLLYQHSLISKQFLLQISHMFWLFSNRFSWISFSGVYANLVIIFFVYYYFWRWHLSYKSLCL